MKQTKPNYLKFKHRMLALQKLLKEQTGKKKMEIFSNGALSAMKDLKKAREITLIYIGVYAMSSGMWELYSSRSKQIMILRFFFKK